MKLYKHKGSGWSGKRPEYMSAYSILNDRGHVTHTAGDRTIGKHKKVNPSIRLSLDSCYVFLAIRNKLIRVTNIIYREQKKKKNGLGEHYDVNACIIIGYYYYCLYRKRFPYTPTTENIGTFSFNCFIIVIIFTSRYIIYI